MISLDKSGGRTVHLFIPFEHNKQRIDSITLSPLRFGHVLQWGKGGYKTMLELLVDLSGVSEAIIRDVRYPDVDRLMECFMSMLTPEIRNDIAEGRIPLKQDDDEPVMTEEAVDAAVEMVAPGTPLPPEMQAGFDMDEET